MNHSQPPTRARTRARSLPLFLTDRRLCGTMRWLLSEHRTMSRCPRRITTIRRQGAEVCLLRKHAVARKFIAYYRVSTDRQGRSGLGLDAQREAVLRHLADHAGELIGEFCEVESGRRSDRPQLAAAIAAAKKARATLIIAKLDRLARNVHFVSGLMESGVDFVAADMPHANKTMIQIHAVMSEWERDAISKRTKDALAAAKARGVNLGKAGKANLAKVNDRRH